MKHNPSPASRELPLHKGADLVFASPVQGGGGLPKARQRGCGRRVDNPPADYVDTLLYTRRAYIRKCLPTRGPFKSNLPTRGLRR